MSTSSVKKEVDLKPDVTSLCAMSLKSLVSHKAVCSFYECAHFNYGEKKISLEVMPKLQHTCCGFPMNGGVMHTSEYLSLTDRYGQNKSVS